MRELHLPSMRPSIILRYIMSEWFDNTKEYTYIILGRNGPTGKTSIYNVLKHHGFRAFEIAEGVFHLVDYTDDKNHFIIDVNNKLAVIVLNHYLNENKHEQHQKDGYEF